MNKSLFKQISGEFLNRFLCVLVYHININCTNVADAWNIGKYQYTMKT
jgi:hypothetical protein